MLTFSLLSITLSAQTIDNAAKPCNIPRCSLCEPSNPNFCQTCNTSTALVNGQCYVGCDDAWLCNPTAYEPICQTGDITRSDYQRCIPCTADTECWNRFKRTDKSICGDNLNPPLNRVCGECRTHGSQNLCTNN
jgi:hypothetical protein